MLEDTDYEAVRALDDAPQFERLELDDDDVAEASPTLRAVALTGSERQDIDAAIADGTMTTDDELAESTTAGTIADVLRQVGDDKLIAKRVYIAEQARGADARTTLLDALHKIINADPGA